jgi:5-methylcytosine-specific restriction endonuclease McrA
MTEIDSKHTCVVCQAEFCPKTNKDGSIRRTKWQCCSRECTTRAAAIAKGFHGEDHNGFVVSARSWKVKTECKLCGKGFTKVRAAQDYCCRSCYEEARRTKPHVIACERCGAAKITLQKEAKFCSRRCALYAWKRTTDPLIGTRKAIAREAAASRAASKAELRAKKIQASFAARREKEADKKAASLRSCRHCRVRYCSLVGGKMLFCGNECSNASAKDQKRTSRVARKALERAAVVEKVSVLKVLRRDGWKCYLCGCDTPENLRGTYEGNAPEADHVVPLSKGGDHSYANLRCACRDCNLIKSDKFLSEIGGPFLPTPGAHAKFSN